MSAPYTVGSYLLDRLKELGIRHIFGVPGDGGFPFDRCAHSGVTTELHKSFHKLFDDSSVSQLTFQAFQGFIF